MSEVWKVEIKVNALTLGIPTTPEYNTKDGFRPILRTEGVRWVYIRYYRPPWGPLVASHSFPGFVWV